MKKIFLLLTTFSLFCNGFSQTKNAYLEKSGNKKATGFILLGIGTATMITGIISDKSNHGEGTLTADITNTLITTSGVICDLISIPFFISANKFKRKAAAIAINNSKVTVPKNNHLAANFQPTISLKILF